MDGVHSFTSPFLAKESEMICFTFWAPEKLPFEEMPNGLKELKTTDLFQLSHITMKKVKPRENPL